MLPGHYRVCLQLREPSHFRIASSRPVWAVRSLLKNKSMPGQGWNSMLIRKTDLSSKLPRISPLGWRLRSPGSGLAAAELVHAWWTLMNPCSCCIALMGGVRFGLSLSQHKRCNRKQETLETIFWYTGCRNSYLGKPNVWSRQGWIKVVRSQGPHLVAVSPLQEGCPLTFPRYSHDVMLLLFKKIKARKKSKYIKGSPQSPYCGSTDTLGVR